MRKIVLVSAFLGIAAAVIAVVAANHRSASAVVVKASPAPTSATAPPTVGVDELMRHVGRYRQGEVRVKGVVSGVSPGRHSVALIDRGEFEQCGLGCADLILPIHWTGAMPKVRESVRFTGRIEKKGGKLLLAARSMDELTHGTHP